MSRFCTDLEIKVIGEQTYEVEKPLVFESKYGIMQVNPKFDFDGASIPQALWGFGLSPMTGGYQRAACLHDALYASEYFEREMCDDIFLEAMESEGVSRFKRLAMYYAVRMFGGSVWKGHNHDEVKSYRRFITVI